MTKSAILRVFRNACWRALTSKNRNQLEDGMGIFDAKKPVKTGFFLKLTDLRSFACRTFAFVFFQEALT